MRPEKTYTIEEFIDSYNSSDINYESTSLIQNLDGYTMISYNIFNDYIDELNELAVYVTLTDEEYYKYLYRPKILAYDLYGSTELFFLILILNNICNVKEFDFKRLKLLKVDDLQQFISSVYNSEKYTLSLNRTKNEGV